MNTSSPLICYEEYLVMDVAECELMREKGCLKAASQAINSMFPLVKIQITTY